jgi:hypothetical protein
MSAPPCRSPIELAALVDYWLGDAGGREQALEEHFFACAHCAARLEELARLGAGVRGAFRAGGIGAIVSAGFLETLKRAGVRVRDYRVAPGESVDCMIRATDDFVIGRMSADLSGVKRLDLLEDIDDGRMRLALEDVPFDPSASEVLICPPPAMLRSAEHVARVRLVAVDEAGSRTIGEYTFNHSAEK